MPDEIVPSPETPASAPAGRLRTDLVDMYVFQALRIVLGLAGGYIVAHALGPAGRGAYGLAVLVAASLVALLNVGFASSNVYFLASGRLSRPRLLKASILAAGALGLASLAVLGILMRAGLTRILFGAEVPAGLVVWTAVLLPVTFGVTFVQAIVLAEQRIRLYNVLLTLPTLLLVLGLAAAAGTRLLTPYTAFAVYVVSQMALAITLLVLYRRDLSGWAQANLSWEDISGLASFSWRSHVASLAQFFNYRLDAFVVNAFLGLTGAGLYSAAVALAEMLWQISNPVATVLYPRVAGRGASLSSVARLALLSLGVSLAAGSVLFLLADVLLGALYGEEFVTATACLRVLLPGVAIFSVTNVLASYLAGIGRPGRNAAVSVVCLALTIALDLLLIPRWGLVGAAVASSASYITATALTLVFFFWKHGPR